MTRIGTLTNWMFAVLLLLIGLALAIPGSFLVYLGGSPYYVVAGVTTFIVAVQMIRGKMSATKIYGWLLGLTAIWSLYEAGLDLFALLPRLAAWLVAGIWFLTPWYRDFLGRRSGEAKSAPNRLWIIGPALAATGLLLLASLQGYERHGTGTVSRAAQAALPTDWRHYGNSAGGTRFAAIDQINSGNVSDLKEIWRYRTGLEEDFKATPLEISGRLYLCAARNVVIALNAETGAEIWRYDPALSAPDDNQYAITCRGVSYHEGASERDGRCRQRIYTATIDASLIALDALTGRPCPGFGRDGVVDLRAGMGKHQRKEYYHTSPPLVAGNRLIVGGLVLDSQKLGLPSGVVRAFDATTGALEWAWDVGNPENRRAPADGQNYTPGTPNVWSVMSYDPQLNLVYLPTGNANPDYFGGERRKFDEDWSSSVVALDATTGSVRWKFQTVHHDIWDYDLPAQPVLVDLTRNGKPVPSIAIPTKTGDIFLLDRRDGTPVYPIKEVRAPSDPEIGEWLSPTQPASPLPNFHPYRYEKDMWGLTPLDQMLCRIEYRMMRYEGMFTPPTRQGSLAAPGNFGGFNWGSVSVDPDNGLLVAAPMLLAHRVLLLTQDDVGRAGPRAAKLLGEDHPAVRMNDKVPLPSANKLPVTDPYDQRRVKYFGLPMPFMSRLGTQIPCFAPPWSRLAVIDLNNNQLLWSRPVGDMSKAGPFNMRSGLSITVGTAVRAGTLTTRGGLTFISSTMDAKVRAYDIRTGQEKWRQALPGNGQSTPMSFLSESSGRQILVVTVPNPSWRYPRDPKTNEYLDSREPRDGKGGYVIAYALPNKRQIGAGGRVFGWRP